MENSDPVGILTMPKGDWKFLRLHSVQGHFCDMHCFCIYCGMPETQWVDNALPCVRSTDPADEQPEPY